MRWIRSKPVIRPKTFVILLVFLGCLSGLCQARLSDSQELFSPANALTFHKIAYESYNSASASDEDLQQAMAFLAAAKSLDPKAKYIFSDILSLGAKTADRQYLQVMYLAFDEYASENIDLEIVSNAIEYMMDSVDSRQVRESILGELIRSTESKNDILASELAIREALLLAERAEFSTAMHYFKAVNKTVPYNKLAFAKLAELSLRSGTQIPPEDYAVHLRLAMGAAPLDIKSAIDFASYLEKQGIYSLAADAYEYSVELFGYLWPQRPLPASLYLPWAVANYNTLRGPAETVKIAEQVRQGGTFDIVLEAIAASAATKTGNLQQADYILTAGEKAEKILSADPQSPQVSDEQLAWFYCFANPQPAKALAWANTAYSRQSESEHVKSILAYALVINGQNESAGELISDMYHTNQIASIARSLIFLASEKRDSAIETLKLAIGMDPTSLAAEKAIRLLQKNGSEYILDTPSDTVLRTLRANFGRNIVPYFTEPAKMITAKLNLSGSDFSYGKDFGAYLVLTNTSSEPLVIFENGLFTGDIRVDAKISGDLTASIPALITKTVRPTTPVQPGQYISIPLQLVTGKLRTILLAYPQAALEIEFTVYIDPVADDSGEVSNTLTDIVPAKAVARRPATFLDGKYLRQHLETINKGRQGQKVRAAILFTGLLAEQYAMDQKPLYRYVPVERVLLKDALRKTVSDSNWTVKLQTMAAMLILPMPMDYELTKAVSDNLNDSNWPVRMMALYLLSKSQGQGFKHVLDWTAKYESDAFLSNFAVSLGGQAPPQQPKQPQRLPQTAPDDTK
jgi:tetratricopeptide (TPR) repeat protein